MKKSLIALVAVFVMSCEDQLDVVNKNQPR